MRKIYLASDSRARKKLLKVFGLNFKVLPAQIKKEKMSGVSYAEIVKRNALAKAKDVAARIPHGLVIGADTIAVQDGKIFGKPKDLTDAHRMLKRLSRKPQWLYTGIAVIDKDAHNTKVAYEKTKVYMDTLSDKEIDDYFAYVSPLDKAGGFDIQARGAFFIRRIEGCFYNVVGLPMRRLYRMLKELGVKIFIIPFLFFGAALFLSGCQTEYNLVTGQEETYFYSTDKEVQMGKAIAKSVEKEYKPVDDPLIQKRVEDIGKKIAAVCDRKEIEYYFKVLDDNEVNAVSLPGGYVYVNKGLIDKVANDNELAGVLAHEVGHIVARHSIKKLQGMMGYSLLKILTVAVPGTGQVGTAADVAFTELMLGYSREDELLADQLSVRYARRAGYDPHGMITFLEKLQEIYRRKPPMQKSYFKTHPYVPDRIRVVKQEIGESIDFTDYINIEQKPHEQENRR
jgi:MAF protein